MWEVLVTHNKDASLCCYAHMINSAYNYTMLASPFSIPQNVKKAPCLRRSRAPCYQSLFLDLHPAGQGEGDPVLGMDRHAINQRGPLACVEFGVELRQALHALDEPLDLPAPDHDLVNPVRHLITLALGFFLPADERVVALIVLGLVLSHPCVLGN